MKTNIFIRLYYLCAKLYCLSPVKVLVVDLKKTGKARHPTDHTESENDCMLTKRAIGKSETKERWHVFFRPPVPKSIQFIINRQSVALVLYHHFTPWPIYKPPRRELCPTSSNKFPFPPFFLYISEHQLKDPLASLSNKMERDDRWRKKGWRKSV